MNRSAIKAQEPEMIGMLSCTCVALLGFANGSVSNVPEAGSMAGHALATAPPWEEMDYGPFLSAVVEVSPDNIASKGIAIPLDAEGTHAMLFDTAELRWAAGWRGDFVELRGIVYEGAHGAWPRIAGETVFTNPAGPGVALSDGSFTDPRAVPYGPLPDSLGRWKGLARDEEGLLLHYTIGGARVWERPGHEQEEDLFAWSRSIEFHDVTDALLVTVLELEDGVTLSAADILDLPHGGTPEQGTEYILRKDGEPVMMIHAKGIDTDLNPRRLGFARAGLVVHDDRLVLRISPPMGDRDDVQVPMPSELPEGAGQIRLLIAPVNATTLPRYRELAIRTNGSAPAMLAGAWDRSSRSLWPERPTRAGELAFDTGVSFEDRQMIMHGPDHEPERIIRPLPPGQTARLAFADGTPIEGSTAWLEDSVVLVDWDEGEEPRLLAGWDIEDGAVTDLHGDPGSATLQLEQVELGDRALLFDGAGEARWGADGTLEFLDTPLTVAAWIRTSKDGTIFSQANPEGPWVPDGKTFFVRGGRLCYDVGWVGVVCGSTEVADDEWHHVAFTWNPSAGEVTLWIDGEKETNKELAPRSTLPGSVVRFGFTAENFPGTSRFTGSIGGMRIIKRELSSDELRSLASGSSEGLVEALAIRGLSGEVRIDERGVVIVPDPVDMERAGELLDWFGPSRDLPDFYTVLERHQPAQPDAFIVDRITWPAENPWRSWMRFGDFDFLDGGRSAALSTWNGDVWIVDGIDADLDELVWQRVASGLSQPLGLKTRDGEILVVGRDQITRLVDLDGDREADRYEAFNVDTMNAPHFHEPASGLQVDAEGNLYYMKGGRHAKVASHPQHGTTIRMSPDGTSSEILASGFRAPNGLWVDPDGVVFNSDQEGHWTPANRINRVERDGFYGYNWSGSRLDMEPRKDYDPPLCWLHPTVDRSPAGLVRVPDDTWGDLAGRLLGISYGTGRVHLVLEDEIGGVHQGGIVPLPIELPTGTMRGRFSPADGDLYLSGLFGWSSNKTDPGGFYRIRRSESLHPMPLGVRAVQDGLVIYFNDPIVTPEDELLDSFSVEAWNYEWTSNYGSLQYELETGRAGTTMLPIEKVRLSTDRRTIWLDIPEMRTAMQVHVEWSLDFENAPPRESFIHLSVHRLAGMSGELMLD